MEIQVAKPKRTKFNWHLFGKHLKEHRTTLELSLREAGELLGIYHATLHRIEHGYPCTAVHYLFLCEWMNVDPMLFVKEHPPKEG